YADRTDDQANQMRAWADHVDLHLRERQLQTRMRHNLTPEGEAEPIAQNAVRAEEAGEIALALDRWQDLLKYRANRDADLRSWGLLAAKRVKELQDVEQCEQHWRRRVDMARFHAKAAELSRLSDRLAALATRAELFGDETLALEQWKSLKAAKPTGTGERSLWLLAARKVRELDAKALRGPELAQKRRDLVMAQLDMAAALK